MIRKNFKYIFTFSYFVFAIWILFFSPYINQTRVMYNAEAVALLTPFKSTLSYIKQAWDYPNLKNIIELMANVGGNILLFVPLGMLLAQSRWFRNHWFIPLVTGALVSLAVETLQFLTHAGYFDIDDIIWNTTGTLAGYGLWYVWQYKVRPLYI